MPTFATPEPVAVKVTLDTGRIRVVASERADTVVEVLPAGPASSALAAAEQTRVELAAGALSVTAPHRAFLRPGGGIEVHLQLPAGSGISVSAVWVDVQAEGRLGACRFSTMGGPIRLERTGALSVSTSGSDVAVERVDGPADVQGATSSVQIRECAEDVTVATANGGIVVSRPASGVTAKTANGDIVVGALVRGQAVLTTARGSVEVGIGEGTAVHVDARSRLGSVHNLLEVRDGPDGFAERASVYARTWYGAITVQRATP
ncbi:DUF4097 family beta strand repeat-containing protein [Dactylosporangium darangshiense]|uniref:DUF4097 family beta strand repeat-containing protein n=1 Tax=Dactylosporangium darangshiense TaxID=579108 RepID=A0ABP8DKY9_9ACTN